MVNRELLKTYHDTANQRSLETGKEPATEPQLYKLLTLLRDPDVSKQDRINSFSALKRGVSKRHASVLIDKLLGKFGQPSTAATATHDSASQSAPAEQTNTTAEADDLDEPFPWDEPLPWEDSAFA